MEGPWNLPKAALELASAVDSFLDKRSQEQSASSRGEVIVQWGLVGTTPGSGNVVLPKAEDATLLMLVNKWLGRAGRLGGHSANWTTVQLHMGACSGWSGCAAAPGLATLLAV